MADHVLRNVNRDMTAAIVNSNRVTDHLGEDCARPAPGAYHLLIPRSFMSSIFLSSFGVMYGPFFNDRDISMPPPACAIGAAWSGDG